jgi:hypothetical protein
MKLFACSFLLFDASSIYDIMVAISLILSASSDNLLSSAAFNFSSMFFTASVADRLKFEFQLGQEFSLLHVVQTDSGAHPASCTVRTRGKVAGPC